MDEFLKAWNNFQWPDALPTVEYRVYYDPDSGKILRYTTESHEGEYILVDNDVFHANRFDWFVKNGKMHPPAALGRAKLRPSEDGTPCHALDITIIATSGDKTQHWKKQTYED